MSYILKHILVIQDISKIQICITCSMEDTVENIKQWQQPEFNNYYFYF